MRDVYLETVRNLYPYYTPKNDHEILLLSGGIYKGPHTMEAMTRFVEEKLQSAMSFRKGTREFIIRNAAKTLDMKANVITGVRLLLHLSMI